MKAKDILAVKGSRVITTHQDNTVMEAIALFFINRVGSLIIVDEHDHIKGILAPNDILKAVHTDLDNIRQAKVSQYMSKDLIVAKPDDKVDYIQAVMTENRVRHIPIMDQGKLPRYCLYRRRGQGPAEGNGCGNPVSEGIHGRKISGLRKTRQRDPSADSPGYRP